MASVAIFLYDIKVEFSIALLSDLKLMFYLFVCVFVFVCVCVCMCVCVCVCVYQPLRRISEGEENWFIPQTSKKDILSTCMYCLCLPRLQEIVAPMATANIMLLHAVPNQKHNKRMERNQL